MSAAFFHPSCLFQCLDDATLPYQPPHAKGQVVLLADAAALSDAPLALAKAVKNAAESLKGDTALARDGAAS